MFLRFGDLNNEVDTERLHHVDRRILDIVKHPSYVHRTYENDLALLRLAEPIVEYSSHIRPICLPQQNEIVHGRKGFVTGWGTTYEGIFYDF